MAHVEKFTFADACHIFSHNDRLHSSNHYSNEEIDSTRTIKNVYFTQPNHAKAKLLEFLNDNSIKKYKHKDLKVCASWIVTLPEQIKKEDQKKFFNACYEFLQAETMCDNINTTLNAVVHYDETTPHLHFCFCPIVQDRKTKQKKVCAKELLTKQYLKNFHERLNAYVSRELCYDSGIIQNKINNTKTIAELKQETKRAEQEQQKIIAEKSKEEKILLRKIKQANEPSKPTFLSLFKQGKIIENLHAENVALKNNITAETKQLQEEKQKIEQEKKDLLIEKEKINRAKIELEKHGYISDRDLLNRLIEQNEKLEKENKSIYKYNQELKEENQKQKFLIKSLYEIIARFFKYSTKVLAETKLYNFNHNALAHTCDDARKLCDQVQIDRTRSR